MEEKEKYYLESEVNQVANYLARYKFQGCHGVDGQDTKKFCVRELESTYRTLSKLLPIVLQEISEKKYIGMDGQDAPVGFKQEYIAYQLSRRFSRGLFGKNGMDGKKCNCRYGDGPIEFDTELLKVHLKDTIMKKVLEKYDGKPGQMPSMWADPQHQKRCEKELDEATKNQIQKIIAEKRWWGGNVGQSGRDGWDSACMSPGLAVHIFTDDPLLIDWTKINAQKGHDGKL